MQQFSSRDLAFMAQRGSQPKQVEKQFDFFKTGFDFANIQRNVTVGDGIVRFSEEELQQWINFYEKISPEKEIVKFVPASGAASRMFKDLFEALQADHETEKAQLYVNRIKDFAFYSDLKEVIEKNEGELDRENKILIEYLLEEKGLNYGNLPKALLRFHKYGNENRTALEEHLVESALYAQCRNRICKLHFTVSPNHLDKIRALVANIKEQYQQRFGVKYDISFSIQDPGTDTLAAELDLTPFRDKNGDLLFRPGGHGALINNLNHINADLVFVKNIDNVITEDKLDPTIVHKKALAGYLFHLQEKSFAFQQLLQTKELTEQGMNIIITHAKEFAEKELMIQFEQENPTKVEVFQKLHRPMRICGVVKNEGEPGGGPFFVTNRKGETSLQIVESSQIDKNNPEQNKLMNSATHFNPVDLICCYKDVNGNLFNLSKYIDPYTGFISEKSYEGRTLLAMELPGLWNGAMADWITIFVEVPLATFNPVKTVFDLLKR